MTASIVVAATSGGCTARGAQPGEVFLEIENNYARAGERSVDRYELRVFRRSATDRRWVSVFRQRYVFGVGEGSSVSDAAVVIREPIGRHVLRQAPGTEGQAMLVEAWPGHAMTGESFFAAAQPSVAQFEFPSGFVGRLTLRFEPVCQQYDPLPNDRRSPYLTCVAEVVREGGAETNCPALESICVTFDNTPNAPVRGAARRTPCAEADFSIAGSSAARCITAGDPMMGDAGVDGGVDAGVDAGSAVGTDAGATVEPGQTLAPRDSRCRSGWITCGRFGDWSRCVESVPCGRSRDGAVECCPTSALPTQCSSPRHMIPRAPPCVGGITCTPSTNLCECGRSGQSCCGGSCAEPRLVCDSSRFCRPCGGANRRCS